MLRCPVTKFVMHTVSHFAFLFLLALATFGFDEVVFEYGVNTTFAGDTEPKDLNLELILRPAKQILSPVQMVIIFWVVGRCRLQPIPREGTSIFCLF